MKNKETIIPVAFILIAAFFLAEGARIRAAMPNGARFGPSFFPTLCASLLLLCSIIELRSAWKRPVGETGGRAPFKLFVLFAISLAVPALLWAVGFLPTGLIALFAFCLLIRIPWPKGLVLSASATLVIYVLFYTLLKVQLPRGLFY